MNNKMKNAAIKHPACDMVLVVEASHIVAFTRTTLYQMWRKNKNLEVLPCVFKEIFPSYHSTMNYDQEVNEVADEIIDIIFNALLKNTDRSQSGRKAHYDGITQSIDTLVYRGVSLETSVAFTHSIEVMAIEAITSVFPDIDTNGFIVTPCDGSFMHGRFVLYIKYHSKRIESVTVNADYM